MPQRSKDRTPGAAAGVHRLEVKAGRRREAEALAAAAARTAAERTAAERAAVEHAAAERAAAECLGVVTAIAAFEWRVTAEESAALAALAAVFGLGSSEDGRCALSSAGCGPEPRGGTSNADAVCAVAPWGRAGGCRALPGRGRRRPHVRRRARRESYYIRCSPPVLLQQHRRGRLDVCIATSRPGE